LCFAPKAENANSTLSYIMLRAYKLATQHAGMQGRLATDIA